MRNTSCRIAPRSGRHARRVVSMITLIVSLAPLHAVARAQTPADTTLSTNATTALPVWALAEPRHKSAGAAALMSFLIPGAGQFYVGEPLVGTLMFVADVAAWYSIFMTDETYAYVSEGVIRGWSTLMAYASARSINSASGPAARLSLSRPFDPRAGRRVLNARVSLVRIGF
jgi:TM2 domain-containing membrane protein YozV